MLDFLVPPNLVSIQELGALLCAWTLVDCSCSSVSDKMTSSKNYSSPQCLLARRPFTPVCFTLGIFPCKPLLAQIYP